MAQWELATKIAHLRNISSRFIDYRGNEVDVPPDNIALILQAMGYDLNDHDRLAQDAFNLDTHQWTRLLEPVYVLNPMRDWTLSIYLPEPDTHQDGQWRFTGEYGETQRQGDFRADALTEIGEYWLDGTRYVRLQLPMPTDFPLGYHTVTVQIGQHQGTAPLIVTPETSFQPTPMARGDRIWGTAIQLYTLRSDRNWGMGDFTDLAELIRLMAAEGADVIGLNPIHALYPVSPEHASPYSPSNRSYVNVLYVDVEAVAEFEQADALKGRIETAEFKALLQRLRTSSDVDYTGVSAAKYDAFRALYAVFREQHLGQGTERDLAFQAFVDNQGEPLRQHATFEALLAYFKAKDINAWGWPTWPEAYQDHHSEAVRAFAQSHADEITYYQYLQFIADEQLQAVNRLAHELGMKIGLYRDLAVGADRGGAEIWTNRESFCLDAAVGAPPDALGPKGQNWGLPPLDPIKLKHQGYQTFITLLRNNMRACGALRIDHAMALLRLWWCPPGETAAKGAYVYYDLFDLLGILNLESQRNHCMVIAEDLGTVPPEVVETFPRAELYSNKVFYFEMGENGCTPPEDYAEKALAIVCNHDMPTVHAFWAMSDLDLRWELGMFANEDDYKNERKSRSRAKQAIIDALSAYDRLPEGLPDRAEEIPEMTSSLSFAIHHHLGSCRSQIVAVQLEDLMLINKPVNIPGTSDEYPNWRRKLTLSSRELFEMPDIRTFCYNMNTVRHG